MLLECACRIEELLIRPLGGHEGACRDRTGNMFSADMFHDAARKRGVKLILGCEVTSRRAVASTGRRISVTTSITVCLRKPCRGSRTSSSWCRRATPRGSITNRASRKSRWRRTARGSIGRSSCLKGEVRYIDSRRARKEGAGGGRRRIAISRRRQTSSSN